MIVSSEFLRREGSFHVRKMSPPVFRFGWELQKALGSAQAADGGTHSRRSDLPGLSVLVY